MASHPQTIPLLLLLLLLAPLSDACGITVYWGQNGFEGPLQSVCSSKNYKYVALAFLNTFGNGQTPVLDLASHCEPSFNTCTSLADDIRFCQRQGIKVLLSLGGPSGNYVIASENDAKIVADYLWSNYLSGSGGPLGDAALDGVDFDVENAGSTLHWDDLAKAIAGHGSATKKIYLSAAPQCVNPDRNLGTAIKAGLFDYVWVKFYNNPSCDYSNGPDNVIKAWKDWSSTVPSKSQLFLGLPAASNAAESGYIEPGRLKTEILPEIKKSDNFGGVMLWNRYNDLSSGYSQKIVGNVCQNLKSQDLLISQVV